MSHGVTCPNCQTELDLSGLPAVPPSVRCGQCSTVFSTADSESTSRWRGDDQASVKTELLPPGALPAANQPVTEKLPDLPPNDLMPPAAGPSTGFDPTPPHLRETPPGQASGPVRQPQGGIQLEVDDNDSPHRRRIKAGGISATWLVVGITSLFAIGAIVIAIAYLQRGPFQIAARESDDLPVNRTDQDDTEPQEIRWTDASRYSARIASVRVKVDRIEFGEVRARNEQREVQTSQDDSFFQLFLLVESQRKTPVKYTSWYGNEFEVDGKSMVAQLSDLEDNVFPMLVFRDAYDIHGHTPSASLNERIEIRDTIVFEIPEEVDIANVSAFRLTLPAAAFGEMGALHFEIPKSMIEEAQRGGGLLDDGPSGGSGLLNGPDSDEPDSPPSDDSSETDPETALMLPLQNLPIRIERTRIG